MDASITSQQRFHLTMAGQAGRPPLFPEGLREGVLRDWRSQGYLQDQNLEQVFHYDHFEELDIAIDLRRKFEDWPLERDGLQALRQTIDPTEPKWLPKRWSQRVKLWKERDYPLFLMAHDGLFLTMGIKNGVSFNQGMVALKRNRGYIEELLALQAEFQAGLARRLLQDVQFDAAIISEPIASNHGSLISPKMYADLVLPSYDPLIKTLRENGVKTIIWRSYANPSLLFPAVCEGQRFDCLWICETDPMEVDYLRLRREVSERVTLIGGIDVDWLYGEPELIPARLEQAVLPLLEQGRFFPLADGRVRKGVPYPHYALYRKTLEQLVAVR